MTVEGDSPPGRGTPRDDHGVGALGEDGLVASVVGRYAPMPSFVTVGPGDDAAVLDLSGLLAGPVVVSTDTLVEGHDFRRGWSSARDVGVKAAAQNLADVAAMGARPLALLVSLAAPADLPARWAHGLADGLDDECRRAGAAVVGGDVSAAAELVVTGTALGVLAAAPVLRSGARPGDVLALAGRTGPSAAGLALLAAGRAGTVDGDGHAPLLAAHRAPRPPHAAGAEAAAAGATAMIDTSDGLLRDAGRIATVSGVVLDLDPAALDLETAPRDLLAAAADLRPDPRDALRLVREWVLAGGEDHALLAAFPAGAALPAGFVVVGRVRPATGGGGPGAAPGVLVAGRPWDGPTGWRHYS